MKIKAISDALTIRSYTYQTGDGGSYEFVTVYPDTPGIVAQGKTFEEAYWKGRALYENAMQRVGEDG